jgi:transcriptional regulator with XRE-family HTH domain
MDTSTDFAALVRDLRDQLRLTQEQFAQKLGVSFSTVNVWENGKREPLPFLRRRLLEMAEEAGLPNGADGPARRRKKER